MKYLLVKRDGLYWCPESRGYTATILQAGVYAEAKAAQYQLGKSEHSLAVPFDASIVRRIETEVARIDPEIAKLFATRAVNDLSNRAVDVLRELVRTHSMTPWHHPDYVAAWQRARELLAELTPATEAER